MPQQRLMHGESKETMPRMLWQDGVSLLTEIQAKQKVGMMLTIIALSLTRKGSKFFCKHSNPMLVKYGTCEEHFRSSWLTGLGCVGTVFGLWETARQKNVLGMPLLTISQIFNECGHKAQGSNGVLLKYMNNNTCRMILNGMGRQCQVSPVQQSISILP